jgi:hypothetical protein
MLEDITQEMACLYDFGKMIVITWKTPEKSHDKKI